MHILPRVLTADDLLAARLMEDYSPEPPEPDEDPAEWPSWTDTHQWVPGPEPIPDTPDFEPSEADRAWFAPIDLAEDLDDRAQTMEALLLADRHSAWEALHADHAA